MPRLALQTCYSICIATNPLRGQAYNPLRMRNILFCHLRQLLCFHDRLVLAPSAACTRLAITARCVLRGSADYEKPNPLFSCQVGTHVICCMYPLNTYCCREMRGSADYKERDLNPSMLPSHKQTHDSAYMIPVYQDQNPPEKRELW